VLNRDERPSSHTDVHAPSSGRRGVIGWLKANRSSARLAFVLRVFSMGINALMSLWWTRVFLHVLGDAVYGLFLSFQGATRLAGLGDFGLSGAVAVRSGQMLGRGEEQKLRPFLASARSALLLMAVVLGAGFAALSPWLPRWLDFEPARGAGSLTLLFAVGGATITVGLLLGYFQSLNAGYATVTWPIVPMLFFSQLTMVGQWILAVLGAPLWVQALAVLGGLACQTLMLQWLLRLAHPWLGEFLPLSFDRKVWRELLTASGWVYLYSLGSLVFSTTDRLLINAGFGSAAVPSYVMNYKACELAMQVIFSASAIGLSKINLWIASPDLTLQARAREVLQQLMIFETFVGTLCALGYLAFNNLFISHWIGARYHVSSALQWAFAINLAVTTAGDAGIQVAGLCGRNGLRTAGLAIGLSGLLNLGLSFISMKLGSITGIAYATVVAQILLSGFLGWHTCRYVGLAPGRWILRACVLPFGVVAFGAVLHWRIGSRTWTEAGLLAALFTVLALVQARVLGINSKLIRHELALLRSIVSGYDRQDVLKNARMVYRQQRWKGLPHCIAMILYAEPCAACRPPISVILYA